MTIPPPCGKHWLADDLNSFYIRFERNSFTAISPLPPDLPPALKHMWRGCVSAPPATDYQKGCRTGSDLQRDKTGTDGNGQSGPHKKIIGANLPSIRVLYRSRVRKQAGNIFADPSHPGHKLFKLLSSGIGISEHGTSKQPDAETGSSPRLSLWLTLKSVRKTWSLKPATVLNGNPVFNVNTAYKSALLTRAPFSWTYKS